MNDTIFAQSTPRGLGAIAIIRLSGPQSYAALSACFTSKSGNITPRMLTYGHVMDANDTVDEVMAVYLPAPDTYTREDIVEIQCHGSAASVHAILQLLTRLPLDLRPAQPGEFTRRAFENGRLDLSAAEAVMDLICAQSAQAVKTSLRQLNGSVSRRILDITNRIVLGMASIEAGIDFPEDDWEDEANANGFAILEAARSDIQALLATYQSGRLIHDGIRCAIVGRPNVGKSSLLNALAGFERALVSEEAGTTRDVVEQAISIDGVSVWLSDTAGMRQSGTALEKRGMALGSKQLRQADVALFVVDGSEPLNDDDVHIVSMLGDMPVVAALNKSDLKQMVTTQDLCDLCPKALRIRTICAQRGEGVEELMRECLSVLPLDAEQSDCITNARHADALRRADKLLRSALDAYADGIPADIAALDARAALKALGEITGQTLTDDVIAQIFSKFCVGK